MAGRSSNDLPGSQALHRMKEQILGGLQEAPGVRPFGMQIEGGFTRPLGVDFEMPGLAKGLEGMDGEATDLVSRFLDDE